MMNILDINERIKQRPPFQMIERVTELVPGESAIGIKCVSVNEPHFAGHFPGAPIMPGVLIVESCAQLCSLVIEDCERDDSILYVLLKVDRFKFIRPVIPGDRMTVSVKKIRAAGGLYTFEASVSVDGGVRAKGELTFTAAPKSQIFATEATE